MGSAQELTLPSMDRPWIRWAVAAEILLVYAGVLLYIWRWQFTHRHAWILLLAGVWLSHLAHRDTLRDLGLALTHLRENAQIVLPIGVAVYVPLVAFGFASHKLQLMLPSGSTLLSLIGYGSWCVAQQYLAQSYFHRRLQRISRNPHFTSALVGLMFGAAHIPSPILVVVTTLGGFVMAEIFARHPNIWPLALAQAVGGILVAVLSPPSLIHHMRVGPGYLFYGVR
jgi:hypothetical protein